MKLQKFGKQFLDVVLDYCRPRNISSKISLKQPKRERKSSRPVKSETGEYKNTYQITLDMHRQGSSISEIAVNRGMSPQTIANHLAQFVETGDLSVEDFVSKQKISQIKSLIDKYGYSSLKDIKENAPDDITYNDIRFVISEIRSV